jgi:phosphoglycerate kinase
MFKLGVAAVDVAGKRVLVRVDFNVPMDKQCNVTSTQRIDAALATINHIIERGAQSVVLISHLGRPDGRRVTKYSLQPLVPILEAKLQRPVTFLSDCVGEGKVA